MASRAYAGPAPSDQGHISADRLFAELDQRRIMGDSEDATIEVISIHITQGAGAWVQMEVGGETKRSPSPAAFDDRRPGDRRAQRVGADGARAQAALHRRRPAGRSDRVGFRPPANLKLHGQ